MSDILNKYAEKDIFFYLKNFDLFDIQKDDLSDTKIVFVKYFSVRSLNKILFILKNKLFFLLIFCRSHNLEYIDQENYIFYTIDTLKLFSFRIKGDKNYMLVSTKYNIDEPGIKEENIEFFIPNLNMFNLL